MKKIFIYISIFTVVLSSCYKDEGNYDYKSIGGINVAFNGNEDPNEPIKGSSGLPLTVIPGIQTDLNQDGFKYLWIIEKDTVSTERELKIEVLNLVARSALYYAKLEINDSKTDFNYSNQFYIEVTAKGFIILSDNGGSTELSYISDNEINGERAFTQVFETVNGRTLGADPKKLVLGSPTFPEGGFLHILVGEGEHGSMTNAASLHEYQTTNESFLDGVYPTGKPNGYINFDNFYSNSLMLWGNKIYKGSDPNRTGVQTYLQTPILEDKDFAYLKNTGSFRPQYIFESNTGTYYYEAWGSVSPVLIDDFVNTGNQYITGSAVTTNAFGGIVIDIIKGTDGKIYEFKFEQGYYGPQLLYSKYEFPTAYSIDENTPFTMVGLDHYYFADGTKLYRRNHTDESAAVELIWESLDGNDITFIKALKPYINDGSPESKEILGNGLIINTYGGSGAHTGNIYIIDDQINSVVELNRFDGIAGKVVDIVWR